MDNFPEMEFEDEDYYVEPKKSREKRLQPRVKIDKMQIKYRCMELLRQGYMSASLVEILQKEFGCAKATAYEYLQQNKEEIIQDFDERSKMQRELLIEELYQLKNQSDDKWYKLAVVDRIIKIVGLDKISDAVNTDTTFTIELKEDDVKEIGDGEDGEEENRKT